MVYVNKTEKIGTTEWIKIRRHARELYIPLKADLRSAFGLKKGDMLKVEILELKRETEDEA